MRVRDMTGSPYRQRGVAAVELGILLIPLVMLAFGITEFGRALFQYNTLAKSTRDAARYLSQQGPGDSGDIAAAKNIAVYGNPGGSGSPLVPGLTTGNISVCDSVTCPATHALQPTGSGAVNLVTVTVTGYGFTSLVPFVVPSLTFNDISTTMRQVL